VGNQKDVGGTGQQESSRLPMAIHLGLDGREQLGRPLDLVNGNGAVETGEKTGGVVPNRCQDRSGVQLM